jgi:hypothetical protein
MHHACMSIQPDSIIADTAFNADGHFAMKAELRKSPVQNPLREEMLGVLVDARLRIDRINAKSA